MEPFENLYKIVGLSTLPRSTNGEQPAAIPSGNQDSLVQRTYEQLSRGHCVRATESHSVTGGEVAHALYMVLSKGV